MNTVINLQEPPSGQGWVAPGTCGDGRWTRVLPNGIFETWAPESPNTVTIATSATVGSQWGLNAPATMDGGPSTASSGSSLTSHEIRTLIDENVRLKHLVEVLEGWIEALQRAHALQQTAIRKSDT